MGEQQAIDEYDECGGNIRLRTPLDVMWERKAPQRAYVAAWRKRHPFDVYGPTWTCPLCDRVLQQTTSASQLEADTNRHQQLVHGADWLAYVAAGT